MSTAGRAGAGRLLKAGRLLRAVRLAVVMALVAGGTLVPGAGHAAAERAPTPGPGTLTACYRFGRSLGVGTFGDDVRKLQVRVAGWAAYRSYVLTDGAFGPQTRAAVQRFQSAYGLPATGGAGPATFQQLYALQDADCTTAHFALSELDDSATCGGGFDGGKVSSGTAVANVMRMMWKLEALRRKLGNAPLIVASGFRSVRCNALVGGASNSQHLYGTGVDVVAVGRSLCQVASAARSSGFSGILGPGAAGHDDHVHLDSRVENNADGLTNSWYWSAPTCGIPSARGAAPLLAGGVEEDV